MSAARTPRESSRSATAPVPAVPLDTLLKRLADQPKDGTELLAEEWGVSASEVVRELVERARSSPPAIVSRPERRWGAFDVVLLAAVLLLLVLAIHAAWCLA